MLPWDIYLSSEWRTPINRFDLRRQNIYARRLLGKTEPLLNAVSFLSKRAPYVR